MSTFTDTASRAPPLWTDTIPSHSARIVIVCTVFMATTTIVFTFRQAWRLAHRQQGYDDVMCTLAYIILLLQTVFTSLSAHYGEGKHLLDIQPTYREALFYFYLYQLCYKIVGCFTKLTFCFLYLRLFTQRVFRNIVWTVIGIESIGTLAFAVTSIFQCLPIAAVWNRSVHGSCYDVRAFWFSHSAFNVCMVIVVYVLPIPMIVQLKIAKQKKAALITIFSFGAFVIAAAIVRMIMLKSASRAHDPTWGTVNALIWTEIEANTSVICCCLPIFHAPVVNLLRLVRRLRSKTAEKSYYLPTQPPATSRGRNPDSFDFTWDGGYQSYAEVSVGKPPPCFTTDPRTTIFNSLRSNWNGMPWKGSDETLTCNSAQESTIHGNLAEPPPAMIGAIHKTTDIEVQMNTSVPLVDGCVSSLESKEDGSTCSTLKDLDIV